MVEPIKKFKVRLNSNSANWRAFRAKNECDAVEQYAESENLKHGDIVFVWNGGNYLIQTSKDYYVTLLA